MVEAKCLYYRAVAGLIAGVFAGCVSGVMYLVMTVSDNDGLAVPLLTVIARALGEGDPAVGWSFHLFNAGVGGLLFGCLLGRRAIGIGLATALGLAMGFIWWMLCGLLLLPALTNQSTWAMSLAEMQSVWTATLLASAVYGILLGAIFHFVFLPVEREYEQPERDQGETEDEAERRSPISRAA